MRLINADNILEYLNLDTVNIIDEFTNAIFKNLPEDVIVENEDELINLCKDIVNLFINMIKTEPTVTKPIAYWIDRNNNIYYSFYERYICSNCGELSNKNNYCPYCGAKMIKCI